MTKRFMTSDEKQDLVFESDLSHEDWGSSRWTETVATIVRAPDDGKLYRIVWERGLTESQEDEFYDGEVDEVFEDVVTQVKVKTVYETATEKTNREQSITKELDSLKKLNADFYNNLVKELQTINFKSLKNELNKIDLSLIPELDKRKTIVLELESLINEMQ